MIVSLVDHVIRILCHPHVWHRIEWRTWGQVLVVPIVGTPMRLDFSRSWWYVGWKRYTTLISTTCDQHNGCCMWSPTETVFVEEMRRTTFREAYCGEHSSPPFMRRQETQCYRPWVERIPRPRLFWMRTLSHNDHTNCQGGSHALPNGHV